MIDENSPILIYVDMPYLKYLGMNENGHFGGHAIVLFGYDDLEKNFYISDRDNHDFHLVSYDEIEKARSSTFRPFPATNKYLTFDFTKYKEINKNTLLEAIRETCDSMLNPPAQLLGLNGILKFSKEIKKWKNFDMQKLRLAGTTNYFQISKDGGTGGGIFRKMYGEFLIELSFLWDNVANDLWQLSLNSDIALLEKMSISIMKIYHVEKNLYSSLVDIVGQYEYSLRESLDPAPLSAPASSVILHEVQVL